MFTRFSANNTDAISRPFINLMNQFHDEKYEQKSDRRLRKKKRVDIFDVYFADIQKIIICIFKMCVPEYTRYKFHYIKK